MADRTCFQGGWDWAGLDMAGKIDHLDAQVLDNETTCKHRRGDGAGGSFWYAGLVNTYVRVHRK